MVTGIFLAAIELRQHFLRLHLWIVSILLNEDASRLGTVILSGDEHRSAACGSREDDTVFEGKWFDHSGGTSAGGISGSGGGLTVYEKFVTGAGGGMTVFALVVTWADNGLAANRVATIATQKTIEWRAICSEKNDFMR